MPAYVTSGNASATARGALARPDYRADIDGLRAIAVLSVIGFHSFPDWVNGGFIGVDIFFVISGFLIGGIIFKGLEDGSFSFAEFYSRRINRIFPALIIVLAASYAFGWFALLADEYKQLGKHIAAGSGFISNVVLWGEAGYFDNAAETKPLLHLWSLGIEEQFYIVWPLLLWLAWRKRVKHLLVCLLMIIASFSINVGTVDTNSVSAFYSPLSRFWELICGSLLAYTALHKPAGFEMAKGQIKGLFRGTAVAAAVEGAALRDAASVLGLFMIVMALFAVTREKSFPGWLALLPTAGAYLILSAGPRAWPNRAVLSNRVLVWVGLISYPLYLWHWTLLSFANIVMGRTPDVEIRVSAVLLSVALAWLTYTLVERPIRFGKPVKLKTISLVVLLCVVGSAGYAAYEGDGFKFRPVRVKLLKPINTIDISRRGNETVEYLEKYEMRLKKEPNYLEKAEKARLAAIRVPFCHFNKPGQTFGEFRAGIGDCMKISGDKMNVLIIGDSHAADLYAALSSTHSQINFLQATGAGCTPTTMLNKGNQKHCAQLVEFAVEFTKDKRLDAVILAARWGPKEYKDLRSIIDRLRSYGQKIIIVGPSLEFSSDVTKIIVRRTEDKNFPDFLKGFIVKEKLILNDEMRDFSRDNGLFFIDRISSYCDGDCPVLNSNGELFILDYGHLSVLGGVYLGKRLLQNSAIENILDSGSPES